MKQARSTSLMKSVTSTAVGFAISFAAQLVFLPMLGVRIELHQNMIFAIIMTLISIARGYAMERVFEAMGWRTRMSAFALAVLAERQRQIDIEGWTPEHDDDHDLNDLASASAAYMLDNRHYWPWRDGYKTSHPKRRKYVIGAAMAIATGESLDRQRKFKRVVTDDRSSERSRRLDSNQPPRASLHARRLERDMEER